MELLALYNFRYEVACSHKKRPYQPALLYASPLILFHHTLEYRRCLSVSMPEFPKPNPDLTQEQALTMILSSIALEEVAFSHIINAEGEKIQYILNKPDVNGCHADLKDIAAVNKSVADLLGIVLQNQMILKNKMDRVLEYLPKPPCPPEPPCPPKPPCPPEPPYPPIPPCMPIGCGSFKHPVCFGIIPKTYRCNEPLLWKENNVWGRFSLAPGDCSKIQMPRTGTFAVDLYLDTGNAMCSRAEMELMLCCEDQEPIIRKIRLSTCGCEALLHKRAVIQMPCSCGPCHASILVYAPCEMRVRQGQIIFTKL